jgi:hypothetical protein
MVAYKQVSLLPWLEQGDIQIGNSLFWKYDPNVLTDADNKTYLEQYVKCYVTKHQKPVDSLTIASYKNKNYFEPLSEEEYQELNFARNILCFLCIAEQSRIALGNNNSSIGPPSAEIFDMVSQNFIPGTNDIAVRSGSMTSGGWKLHEIHFQEPWSTGGFFRSINRYVHTAINKLLASQSDEDFKNRLLRSMEWFRLAHVENGSISPFFRIVMMATAFEIIFDVPNIPDKAGYVADKIDETLAQQDFIQESRTYGKNNDKSKTRSIAAWWGWDFYKLRNSVVHGDNISLSDLAYTDWITHAIVADMMFYAYVTYLLAEAKYFQSQIVSPDFESVYKLFKWKQ